MEKAFLVTYNWDNKAWSDTMYIPALAYTYSIRGEREITNLRVYDIAENGTLTELYIHIIDGMFILVNRRNNEAVEIWNMNSREANSLRSYLQKWIDYAKALQNGE